MSDPQDLRLATYPVHQVPRRRFSRLVRAAGPAARRALDVVASGLGLLLLSPLLLFVAFAIKITSRGPVLFYQNRVGRAGREFPMWKFRTMLHGAEAQAAALAAAQGKDFGGVRFKMKVDPRVTRVGRVLRKLSIDELPQLWNVLRGDMTLVGPRPALPREVKLYDPRALRRLEVTPGLTCLWQISGRSDLSFEQQVELDIQYIDQSKPVDDLKILARTVPAVISGRGAY
ncbi:MAG: sugar transferase [Polyangiaceae bacterium]|jgi:lipopolysaccharide/colanic/teichoic acid biosynthesis glycosyltransferase|nr:sugar transferase [Polyangiaceae bacterium]